MRTAFSRSFFKLLLITCLCAGGWMLPAHATAKDYVSASAYWEDPSGQATFEQAQQQHYTPYQGTLSRGYSRSDHWVRLRIDGADPAVVGEKLVLRIRPVFLDRITLFDPAEPSPQRPRVTGDLTPWSEAEWQSSNLGFVIPAQPLDRDIWLRLQTNSTHFMMVQAVSMAEARRMDHLQGLGYNLSVAVLFVFWAWMLIAWLNERDTLNGVFVITQTAVMVYTLTYFGYHRTLLSDWLSPEAIDRVFSYANITATGATIWFERYLLCEYVLPLWARRLIRDLPWLAVLPPTLLFFGYTQPALRANMVVLAFYVTFSTVVAIFFLQDEPSPRAYRLPKRVIVGYYLIITSLMSFGVLPILGVTQGSSWAIMNLVLYGFISGGLMTVLLQFRAIRLEQQRREVANQLYLSQQQVVMEREQREEQTHFLHMLMHELKNPLAVIDMALHTSPGHAQSAAYASRAVSDMKAIIERCVDADQLEEGKLDTSHDVVDLQALIQELFDGKYAQEKRLHLHLDHVLNVITDPQYLRIILGNLIDNAVRYSARQSSVHIHVEPAAGANDEPGIEVTVANQPGIAGWPDAEHVFRKYYRSAGALSQSGTGLGLFLVASLAKRIGALVRYAPNETHVRFVLWLPA